MAKYLKDVLNGVKSSTKVTNDLGGYKPKAGDEQDFVKKHEIEKHADRVGNGDDVYKGTTKYVLANAKEKNHGYKKPEDTKVNEEQIDELSTDLLHRAAHKAAKKAMTDVQGRSGPIFKKRAAQANKFRAKGMEQEKKEKAMKEEVEILENSQEIAKKYKDYVTGGGSTQTASRYKSHVNMLSKKTGQHPDAINKEVRKHVKSMKEELLDEISTKLALSYAKGASKSMDTAAAKGSAGHETFMKRSAGHKLALDKTNPEHKRLKAKVGTTDANAKDAAYKKAIGEGANVDRMVAHVKSSEKAAGKSDKKAESIAWATANKRGMLDNKNKKVDESDTPITFPNKQSNNAVGQNV